MSSERRYVNRLTTAVRVWLKNDMRSWEGLGTDVSIGGMKCWSYAFPYMLPQKGECFSSTFVLPTGKVEGTVEVKWISEDGETVGVHFEDISDRGRRFLESYCTCPF